MSGPYLKLHPVGFALAWGLLSAMVLFLFGIFAMAGYGAGYVTMLSSVYLGYNASFTGAVAGALWGFIYGFIMGLCIALLYNNFVGKEKKK